MKISHKYQEEEDIYGSISDKERISHRKQEELNKQALLRGTPTSEKAPTRTPSPIQDRPKS
jgi:hypothetical protein